MANIELYLCEKQTDRREVVATQVPLICCVKR